MTKKFCIYHKNCADGFGAAWVVRKFYGIDPEAVEFFPATHGDNPPDVTGRDVIMVDFSFKTPVIKEMMKSAYSILILDHHKTAVEDLHWVPIISHKTHVVDFYNPFKNIRAEFDMNRSGAMITWDYFFPNQEPPQLLKHIQDRDLWLFKLEGTREIQANLFSYPYDFDVWDKLMEMPITDMVADGVAIERKQAKDIAELIPVFKRRMKIGGYDVPVANLPYTLSSESGNIMAQNEPFAGCYYDTKNGREFSLRSTDAGVDVGEIAKLYGGGGHRNAAGFRKEFGWAGE